MNIVTVYSQKEFDDFAQDPSSKQLCVRVVRNINISDTGYIGTVEINRTVAQKMYFTRSPGVMNIYGCCEVICKDGSTIKFHDSSSGVVYGGNEIIAIDRSSIIAVSGEHAVFITATDKSNVVSIGSAVKAFKNSTVVAIKNSTVYAHDESTVFADGSSLVKIDGNAKVIPICGKIGINTEKIIGADDE